MDRDPEGLAEAIATGAQLRSIRDMANRNKQSAIATRRAAEDLLAASPLATKTEPAPPNRTEITFAPKLLGRPRKP